MTSLRNLVNNKEVYTVLETITPKIAADFLAKNTNNRSLSSKTVAYYKDMIVRDRWMVNGESIKIAIDGTLLDGQHRLEAIRLANKAVKMFVTYNIDDDSFTTIDAGRPRRHSDYLKVSGKSGQLSVLAAAVRVAMGFTKNGEYVYNSNKIPPDLLLWFLDQHPGLEAAVDSVSGKVNNICSRSIASSLKYIFSVVDENAAESFFEALISGANLSKESPVLVLRNRLANIRGGGGTTWQREVIHCFVTAFNAYLKNKKVVYLKFLDGQKTILDGFKGQLSDKAFVERK